MVKGVSIKFRGYGDTIPKLLEVIKFGDELKKHERIVLKPSLGEHGKNTNVEFLDAVLKFCMENKNPGSEVFIAEGFDGDDTMDVFEEKGFRELAEKYGIGLLDLNKAEVEEIENSEFLRFDSVMYPRILLNSFVVSISGLENNEEEGFTGSLGNMVGAFPSKYYSGFFSIEKNKIKKWPLKFQIHDIVKCKMPDFALLDNSENGFILAGQPLEIDKQAAMSLGLDWRNVGHLRLIDEGLSSGEVGDR